jgi:hypothetical protein
VTVVPVMALFEIDFRFLLRDLYIGEVYEWKVYSSSANNVDNLIDYGVGAAVGALEFAVRAALLIWASDKLAVSDRAEDPLVEERKQ